MTLNAVDQLERGGLGEAMARLSPARRNLYRSLEQSIGNTPLIRFPDAMPNGCRLWIKRECDNPFGSHYDRVYLALFAHHEGIGDIQPGCPVIETTSGSAGVSFAGIGRELGYECFVAIPDGGEKARENAIKAMGGAVILTPPERYIAGLPRFIKQYLVKHRDVFFLNHSRGAFGTNNEISLEALGDIAREVPDDIPVAVFCAAIGNGSSVLGPGRVFRDRGCQTVGFEPFSSAVAYDLLHGDVFQAQYGIDPKTLPRHRLPGTSFRGVDFPHIKASLSEEVLRTVVLVSDREMDRGYFNATGRTDTEALAHWDDPSTVFGNLGRSSRAGIAVARVLAEDRQNDDILIIGYDVMDRYDS